MGEEYAAAPRGDIRHMSYLAPAIGGFDHLARGGIQLARRGPPPNGYACGSMSSPSTMTVSVDELLGQLQAFQPAADGADNVHRLSELLGGFASLPGCERVAPALLELIERHPQADFGTPGPLVHALESQAGYPELLAASLERQPTELTAWMANRLLNSKLARDHRAAWLKRLTAVTSHPRAAASVRDSAIRFLDFQASRHGR